MNILKFLFYPTVIISRLNYFIFDTVISQRFQKLIFPLSAVCILFMLILPMYLAQNLKNIGIYAIVLVPLLGFFIYEGFIFSYWPLAAFYGLKDPITLHLNRITRSEGDSSNSPLTEVGSMFYSYACFLYMYGLLYVMISNTIADALIKYFLFWMDYTSVW